MGTMPKLTDFKVLTFDCYGTLIDWESGLFTAMQPLLAKVGRDISRDEVLETFARHESAQEGATPSMRYSDVLAVVHGRMAEEWGAEASDEENRNFGASVPDWPAFPDSPAALKYLKSHYRLVILSNVDRASFAGSKARLGVEFDAVYTAEEIGSYKPDRRNFEFMLARLAEQGFERRTILHTAQSLFHDHVPANAMGLASAWIDRRHGAEGGGATVMPESMPRLDFRFTSLGEMAEAHRREMAG